LGNYFKIRYVLGNYHVLRIPQIHILNFNHEYLTTPHSHVAAVMLPCCHCAALLPPLPPLCCRHRRRHAATPLLPRCHYCYAVTTATLLPLLPCCHQAAATTTATMLPPLLPPLPSCRGCRQAATAAVIYIVR
jgi:hypothetical protein